MQCCLMTMPGMMMRVLAGKKHWNAAPRDEDGRGEGGSYKESTLSGILAQHDLISVSASLSSLGCSCRMGRMVDNYIGGGGGRRPSLFDRFRNTPHSRAPLPPRTRRCSRDRAVCFSNRGVLLEINSPRGEISWRAWASGERGVCSLHCVSRPSIMSLRLRLALRGSGGLLQRRTLPAAIRYTPRAHARVAPISITAQRHQSGMSALQEAQNPQVGEGSPAQAGAGAGAQVIDGNAIAR